MLIGVKAIPFGSLVHDKYQKIKEWIFVHIHAPQRMNPFSTVCEFPSKTTHMHMIFLRFKSLTDVLCDKFT